MGRELPRVSRPWSQVLRSAHRARTTTSCCPPASDAVDWEAELGGGHRYEGRADRRGRRRRRIAGFTVVNDVTVRDWQYRTAAVATREDVRVDDAGRPVARHARRRRGDRPASRVRSTARLVQRVEHRMTWCSARRALVAYMSTIDDVAARRHHLDRYPGRRSGMPTSRRGTSGRHPSGDPDRGRRRGPQHLPFRDDTETLRRPPPIPFGDPSTEAVGSAPTPSSAQSARLTDTQIDGPSALPGWNRATLLTHLARNADALGNLLTWARTGVETPMYADPSSRAADIDAGRSPSARGEYVTT